MACTPGVSQVCLVYLVYLVHLVSFVQPNRRDRPNRPDRPAEVCDIEEWGAAAGVEAQWRHPFETSEISVIIHTLTSGNIVSHREGILA